MNPYENNAFIVIVVSGWLPSSQKTAGFEVRMKKNGIKGKKNPTRTPWTMEGPEDDGWESADSALSMESIHCSSNALACSVSVAHD